MTKLPQEIIKTESERLAALRMQMLEMHPFWGYVLLQVRLIPTQSLPTMATDCVRHIWFNPLFTQTLETRELGFVLMHQICHQVLESLGRRDGREPFKWNMATDYAINDMIGSISTPGAVPDWRGKAPCLYKMPKGGLCDARYHGMVAETIYEDLCRRRITPTVESITIRLQFPDGSEAEFPSVTWPGGCRDIHLPIELTEDQREILRDRIRAAVENRRANADRGDIPGEWLRQLGLYDPPKIPWRRVLHRYADVILHQDDYSLACPNKRFLVHDLIVPGHYNEKLDRLVVSLDTSGSMEDDAIRAVLSELLGMVGSSREITLIVADSRVRQVVTGDELESFIAASRFDGGGGTDHKCVFDHIARHHLDPGLFIGLTDLYSSFPERKPPYPVLWVTPGAHAVAPWGKVIEL